DPPALRVRVEKLPVQRRDQRAHGSFRRDRHAQLLADALDELAGGELRIQDQRNLGLLRKLLENAADQRRLAGADLARELNEAAALRDAVDQVRERVGMAAAQIQVARIGRDREGLFVEAEKFGVHEIDLDVSADDHSTAAISVVTRR